MRINTAFLVAASGWFPFFLASRVTNMSQSTARR
jgi:hypothetical protein